MEPVSLVSLFQRSLERFGDRTAMVSLGADGPVEHTSYAVFGRRVREASLGLQALGVAHGDRVSILSRNRPEWAIADLAIAHAGAVGAPVYDTLLPDQVVFTLNDAGSKVLFVEDERFLELALSVKDQVKGLETLVTLTPVDGAPEDVLSLDALEARGRSLDQDDPGAFERRMDGVRPDDLVTFIYTSGTTGDPKGVILTHWNIASNILTGIDLIDIGPDDVYLSFLPLSHSFERSLGHYAMYTAGVEVHFARSVDTLLEDLKAVRPTIFLSVPRLYEKIYQGVLAKAREASPLRRRLFAWALETGGAVHAHREAGTRPGPTLGARHALADRLVLAKVRAALGLDRMRFAGSGAAALPDEVARFFGAIGVLLLEGYGLSEASPILSVNLPERFRIGTVGRPIPGVEVRIDTDAWEGEPGEGELLARGPGIMQGYWQRPEDTAEALDDGWLRTGDVATIDEDGWIRITDRKKELFKTLYGKYVAPQRVEGLLALQPRVAMAAAIGAERKYVSALLVPDFEALEAWASERDLAWRDHAELVARPEVRALYQQAVENANGRLARYEQVKRFALVPRAFEVGIELTPTMKLKRRVVEERYAGLIEGLYEES